MADPRYDLFFSGQIMPGEEPASVRDRVGKLFGADTQTLDRLFSGKPIRIKSDIDQETAGKYRLAFRKAGALVEIRPIQEPPASAPSDPRGGDTNWELLPPRSGSLIDCAPHVEPQQIPDTTYMQLAPAGETLDDRPPHPPPNLDTSAFTLAPVRSGSLEEHQIKPPGAELPDNSALQPEE